MSDQPRRRGYHHGNLREALIEATIDLIEEKGPQGFTIAEAAKRAGVSAAAPYRHFAGRDDLIAEVARCGFVLFAELMEFAYDDGGPSALSAFLATGRAYLAFAEKHPGYYMAMFESGVPLNATPELARASERATAILTVLTVAISVMLFLGVEKVRHGARESFENTISGVDLIVGARSSPVNLLLYSVFHIGDATNNITWESYETVASAPGVAWTVPISLGDSHRGHRVIGSTPDLFEYYQYGGGRNLEFASGQPFSDLFGAVIGAAVAAAASGVTTVRVRLNGTA